MDNKKRNKKIVIAVIVILVLLLGTYCIFKGLKDDRNVANNEPKDIIVEENNNNEDGNEIIESDALENVENTEDEVVAEDNVPVVVTNAQAGTVVRNNTTTNKKNNNTTNNKTPVVTVPDTEKPNASVSIDKTKGAVKSVSVTINATDNKGVSKIMYYVGTTESNDYKTASGNSITLTLNGSNYSDGTYYIWYYAVDTSGNKSDVKKAGPYKLDNTPPYVNPDGVKHNLKSAYLEDDGTISFKIDNGNIEKGITVVYSIVGNGKTGEEKVANIDDYGKFILVTTIDTYEADKEYTIAYMDVIDSAGNRINVAKNVTIRVHLS